jgi:hypothetical protein
MGRHVKNRQLEPGSTTVEIPTTTTANRPTGQNGQIIFNTTTSTYQGYIGSQWYNISSAAGEKTLTIDRFQGDGTTTVFGAGSGNTLDGSTAATLSVVPTDASDMMVFVGGVYQIPTTNYTFSGGQITFGSAPPANDGATNGHIITVVHNLHKLGE